MILLWNKALKLVGKLLTFVNFKNVPTDRLKRLRQMGFKVEVNTGDEKKDFHSQYGQDYLVYTRYFTQNPRSGTFIDFGAHDGITFSNTCFFERVLGWSGILVEPNPNVFSKLQKNRDTISINVGVGPKEESLQFLKYSGYGEMLSCFETFAQPEHLKRIEEEQKSHGFQIEKISVPLLSVTQILSKLSTRHINLLSIDVEGFELQILKSFPFDSTDVDVICLEVNCNPLMVERFLEDRQFRLVAIVGTDHVYESRDITSRSQS